MTYYLGRVLEDRRKRCPKIATRIVVLHDGAFVRMEHDKQIPISFHKTIYLSSQLHFERFFDQTYLSKQNSKVPFKTTFMGIQERNVQLSSRLSTKFEAAPRGKLNFNRYFQFACKQILSFSK